MSTITVYGIPNCDTTQKALSWLKKNKIAFAFHDYKQSGISREKLEAWAAKENWELLFNKRSTSWRELPAARQQKVEDAASAIKEMLQNNSIIKRPVVEYGNRLLIGFSEEVFKKAFF